MTHDELVKFAAGKVGVSVHANSGVVGGWLVKSGVQTNWDRSFPTELSALESVIDLSSPDLMVKGMGVLLNEQDVCVKVDREEVDIFNYKTEAYALRERKDNDDVPTLFWQCWAELEGGQG